MPTDEEWASNLMDEGSLSNMAGLTPADSMQFESQYPSPFNDDNSVVDRNMSSENSNASTAVVHCCVKTHPLARSPTDSTTSLPIDDFSTANSTDAHKKPAATPTTPCGCTHLVLRKLFVCSNNSSVPLSWDLALNQIKETTALCTSVIHCHICHNPDATHVLTIAALIAKIIAFSYTTCDPDHYSHVDSPSQHFNPLADIDSAFDINLLDGGDRAWSLDTIDYNMCPKASTLAPSVVPPSALLLRTPSTGQARWAVGAYSLDSKDEKKLKLEICKIELSKVGTLFQDFKKRFCVAVSHDEHTKPETKAYHDLASYLEQKLVIAVQRLRACH